MQSTNDQEYFQYLKQRSLIGQIYHKWYLYPRICKEIQGKVLDFGCGIGDFLSFRLGTAGVDINEHNVAYCKSRGFDASVIEHGMINSLDKQFDSVVMDNVLEHIPENQVGQVLEEIKRVLKVDGRLVIGVPGLKGYQSDSDHKVYYTKQNLIQLLEKHCFFKDEIFAMPLPWNWLGRYLSQYCIYATFTLRGMQEEELR
ncbi:MAG: methyltransferase domain-containing protein [Mariprofundaceae bacterium]|nr:methyltransferase domain-containing protein [Mariprofundaceae bacterium]